ncbi:hypothetical protein DL93DRAFT_2063328 [Clavulina sp. PMI_390]|nr:hypothetical protein DL93DRAFT_2063328 [Clavulina sp. PMI_390]
MRDEPDESPQSTDFCNAFWGPGDGGVDVLFARMRGAARTAEEMRAFWRERAAIEDEYSKRLAKLSKQPLGRDEIGELRNALDTLRSETEAQASAHAALCVSLRKEVEAPTSEFISKQAHHKKTAYNSIEKAFKIKQQQESVVAKAREKYKTDCVNINLYTAQSSLVQGRDLDRILVRLDKAKQTVVQNERDYANYVATLQDTCNKWEGDWKMFCDHCQDLEDERIEFMKDNLWTYANAVSTVCVSDDESCEKVRVTLEQLEPERDMENFVREYGTGPGIPDPPRFQSYANGVEPPPRPGMRPSQYSRTSSRSVPSRTPTGIVDEYQQALPGERMERRLSGMAPGSSLKQPDRGPSPRPASPGAQAPFAGIGANGRSASPQPMQRPLSRGPSPALSGQPQAAPQRGYGGQPIIYISVRALYDYTATIDEEFDFQSGDIIAVTSTPEDGWWSGVLLDDARRIPGRTVFPSNFVCLF